jgi:hypothetical protein
MVSRPEAGGLVHCDVDRALVCRCATAVTALLGLSDRKRGCFIQLKRFVCDDVMRSKKREPDFRSV